MTNEAFLAQITTRAEGSCELCSSAISLPSAAYHLLACTKCISEIEVEPLEPHHWRCLQESAWSQLPGIQILAWRLLSRLSKQDESWAGELIDQLYLEEEDLLEAKRKGVGSATNLDSFNSSENTSKVKDSNGALLSEGDSVTLIKDLAVKGAGFTAKRGTLVKNIHLIADNTDYIDARVNKIAIQLKTCF